MMYYECPVSGRAHVSGMYLIILECLKLGFDTDGAKFSRI